ncbi:MAG TPA: M1 family metallopeptidase [Nocardioidaceae bacterium]|nr:M1 family metallopeptidase [Nocardioidaceae bacterium]
MRRLTHGITAVLTASALVMLSGSTQAESASTGSDRSDTTGAAGIGDPYFPNYGNGGYRVGHYNVRVAFHPKTERLRGVTGLKARATKRLTRFNLDLVLHPSKVKVNGHRARFRHHGHELVVRPAHAIGKGDRMRVRVWYAGVPKNLRDNGVRPWITNRDGAVALGQPEIAAWWFPSNDHPRDKAAFDLRITVPHGRQAISNGRLVGVKRTATRSTWHWRMPKPMATYLAFAAMGRYDLMRGKTRSGRPYLYAVDKALNAETQRHAREALRKTGPATGFLTKMWGRYPFRQIGGVVPSGTVGYALETQTRPVYDAGFFYGGGGTLVVVHEMAHQWFGDAVALRRWQDIWLNEGLATYSEWLWAGHHGGETVTQRFHRLYRHSGPHDSFWDLKIGDPGPRHIFAGKIYVRGAMTAQALRMRVGSRDFFRICRLWVHHNADGVGTTREFKRLAERVSGRQLDRLFRAWLYSSDRPPLP